MCHVTVYTQMNLKLNEGLARDFLFFPNLALLLLGLCFDIRQEIIPVPESVAISRGRFTVHAEVELETRHGLELLLALQCIVGALHADTFGEDPESENSVF